MKILFRISCACFVVFMWFPPITAQAKDTHVNVMSYNIHFGVGMDGVYNLNRIANVIRNSNADIVGLQEVDVHFEPRTQFDNQIKILAEKLGMNYFFAPIYDFDPFYPPMYYAYPAYAKSRRLSGVAVLSKFPITKTNNHPLTRLSTEELKQKPQIMPGFAEAVIDIYGTTVPVFVTHLDYREDKTIREKQVREMVSIMTRHHGESILLGDLNATPTAAELRPLFDIYHDSLVQCTQNCFTFPSDSPYFRIDYVLVAPGIQVKTAKVINTTASDHRPVVAKLQFHGKIY